MIKNQTGNLNARQPHGVPIPANARATTIMVCVAAGAVGLAISYFGWVASLVLVIPLIVLVAVARPLWVLVFLALLIPLENAITVEALGTGVKLVGLGLACGWVAGKFIRRESWARIATSKPLWAAVVFLAAVGMSILWAEQPLRARSGFIQLVQLFAIAVISVDVCRSRGSIEAVIKGLILGALVAAALTVFELLGGSRRAGEMAAGINGTAELLVTLLPLVFYFVQSTSRVRWRLVGMLYLAVGSVAVLATFSRMSVMLLPLVTGFLLIRSLRSPEARRWLLPILGAAVVTGMLVIPWDRVDARVRTILPYIESTFQPAGSAESPVMSSRGYHLLVGLKIFEDHPLLGVGYNNYGWYFLYRYQHRVPGADALYLSERSPHSSHIGILADLGLLGALVWTVFLLSVLVPLWKTWRSHRGTRSAESRTLSRLQESLLLTALLQVIPYALYGPNQKQKFFWLLVGLCVALTSTSRLYYLKTRVQPSATSGATDWAGESDLQRNPWSAGGV